VVKDQAENGEEISEPTILTFISGRWVRTPIGKPGHKGTCSADTYKYKKRIGHSAVLKVEECPACGARRVLGFWEEGEDWP